MQPISTPSNHTVVQAGPMTQWGEFQFQGPNGFVAPKLFLKERLGLTSMEVSLNSMPPGSGMSFTHHHRQNEELYVFLTGVGEFQAGAEVLPITAGTCVRCAPETPRAWRNTGAEPLTFMVVQAKEGTYGPKATVQDGALSKQPLAWA